METEAQSAEDTWGEFLADWRRIVPVLIANLRFNFQLENSADSYPPLRDADDWP